MSQEMDAAATIGDVSSDAPEQAPDLAVEVTRADQVEAGAGASARQADIAAESAAGPATTGALSLAALQQMVGASPERIDLWRQCHIWCLAVHRCTIRKPAQRRERRAGPPLRRDASALPPPVRPSIWNGGLNCCPVKIWIRP